MFQERAVKKASQLENEKEELLEVLEKKNKEVERLNGMCFVYLTFI